MPKGPKSARKYLSNENLKLLVNALVISRLEYCTSILYGLPKQELDKLQRIQNIAARLEVLELNNMNTSHLLFLNY